MIFKKSRAAGVLNYEARCNELFSRIILFTGIVMLLNFIEDLRDDPIVFLLDLLIIIVLAICYLLNSRQYHLIAKIIFVTLFNIILFYFSAATHSRNSVALTIFPFVAIILLIMGKKNKFFTYSMVGFSLAIMIYLEYYNYQISWISPIGIPVREPMSVVINVVSAFLVLIFAVLTLIKINTESEINLLQNQEKLGRANSELDRFVYNVSHDLRAPLSSIKGLVDISKDENDLAKLREYLGYIESRTIKLDNFITEIIEYSRNASTDLKLEEINPNEVVDEILDNLKFQENADKVKFKRLNRVDKPIRLDKSRFKIILNNLVSNAIKYHDYLKNDPWIKVEFMTAPDKVLLVVADNGTGIKKEHQEKVFEMFYRASNQSQGSGLGLYIVKEMVQKMHGKISVQSEPSKGSEFRVVFDA